MEDRRYVHLSRDVVQFQAGVLFSRVLTDSCSFIEPSGTCFVLFEPVQRLPPRASNIQLFLLGLGTQLALQTVHVMFYSAGDVIDAEVAVVRGTSSSWIRFLTDLPGVVTID